MKKFLIAGTMAATLMGTAASAENIGVSMALFDDNFLTILRNGIQETADKDGLGVQIEDAQDDVAKQLDQINLLRHPITEEGAGDPFRAILVDYTDCTDDIDEAGAFFDANLALVTCSTDDDDAYLWRRKLANTDQNLRAL